MNEKTAENILNLTEISYQSLASDFSSTRSQIWQEFIQFKQYINNGDFILDIGCGNGRLLEIFKVFKINYTGIDKSPHLLDIAKKNYPEQKFIEGDILDLKEQPNRFDIVFAIAVLNHIPTEKLQIKALKNIYNVLKPGGFCILTNWNLWNLSIKKKGILRNFIDRMLISEKEWDKIYKIPKKELRLKDIMTLWKSKEKSGILYYYAFTKNELVKLLEHAGFKVEKAYYSKGMFAGGNIITIAKKK